MAQVVELSARKSIRVALHRTIDRPFIQQHSADASLSTWSWLSRPTPRRALAGALREAGRCWRGARRQQWPHRWRAAVAGAPGASHALEGAHKAPDSDAHVRSRLGLVAAS